jgi:IS30 family transposase
MQSQMKVQILTLYESLPQRCGRPSLPRINRASGHILTLLQSFSCDRRGMIANQVSIEERPKIVGKQSRVGAWEGNCVITKNNKGALVTLVELKSLYTVIATAGS